jgi:Lon protease-like protein
MPIRPMFPLGSVLLPSMVLPLHVFEERYRAMVRDCLAGEREFGVTLIERGSEVGGGDIRAMAGTVAEIVQAEEFDDGRWGIVAVGTRRVRVTQWLPDDPYPRAEVEDWPEGVVLGDDIEERFRLQVAALRKVIALAVELGADASPMVELSDDPVLGSYQIAVLAPFGSLDRHRVLVAPDPSTRLDLIAEMLADQELLLRARMGMDGDEPDEPEGLEGLDPRG